MASGEQLGRVPMASGEQLGRVPMVSGEQLGRVLMASGGRPRRGSDGERRAAWKGSNPMAT